MEFPQIITLTRPLPWSAGAGLSGHILAITTDRLRLELTNPTLRLSGLSRLAIADDSGTSFLKGHSLEIGEKSIQEFVALEPDDLRDLLGKIRKDQHLSLCQNEDVEAQTKFTGLSRLNFRANAVPELNEDMLDTTRTFLGYDCRMPLMIAGMTGGIAKGASINRILASAATAFGIPMGIGSQRLALENADHTAIFALKRYEPHLFLIGNVGGAQLLQGDAVDFCQRAADMIEADALAIHLNVLQECVQVEGDRHFRGLLQALTSICQRLTIPVLVKEVGCGISGEAAARLAETGIAALDIGGKGGTSWGYIEGLRSASSETKTLGQTFRDFGIPTAYSLASVRTACPKLPVIATGGLRSGLDLAKVIGLGASLAGVGLPLLRAALVSEERVHEELALFQRGLKITMMATGSQKLDDLGQHLCLGEPEQDVFERYVTRTGLKNSRARRDGGEDQSLGAGK